MSLIRMVWFSVEQHNALLRHAAADAPREACGVLLGSITSGVAQVNQVIPVANIADDPHVSYRLDDTHLARIVGGLARTGGEIVGFYHSHPASAPIPSSSDVRLAAYADVPYVIVGQRAGGAVSAAWRIADGAVEPIDSIVADVAPLPPPELGMSFQYTLLVLAAVTVCVMVIAAAILLLPPAPVIPR
ncbi:MAG: M67 family metallopeptidase [Chloroflexota bacterium]|nr:M67 family metallopeptidase [Chloroflexota bacterium]